MIVDAAHLHPAAAAACKVLGEPEAGSDAASPAVERAEGSGDIPLRTPPLAGFRDK